MSEFSSIIFFMFSENRNDFPFVADIFISGSSVFKKFVLKVLSPEKPERTINKAIEPTITLRVAIKVIIFIVLLLLLENKYLLAM